MLNEIVAKIKDISLNSEETIFFEESDRQYTYKELDELSDSLAGFLEETYPEKTPIIVYGAQEALMVISFLACTKSGHSYVPIDDHTPKERVAMIVEEANASCVLALSEWPLQTQEVYNRKEILSLMNDKKEYLAKQVVCEDDVYYIIFTSGTTGKPKGVQITYNNLISFTSWMLSDFHLKENQRFLCQAPFSFDLSVMDLYPALLTAGTLIPMPKTMIENFPLLFKSIPEMDLNVWVSTPSLIEMVLLNPEFTSEHLPTLENFEFCGEELPKNTAQKLLDRFPQAKIYNTYGPTETTVAITNIMITQDILDKYERVPLGKVKSDTKIYILNDKGEKLPDGEIGEIVISGPSVSVGYFNNPDKTNEVFFEFEGETSYRTGDAGLIEDDLLFYKGRMDFQIKLNGYRMELGDIDHHLITLSEVRAACSVPKYNKAGKVQQLLAYVVLESAVESSDEKELTQKLKEDLNKTVMDYMVPHRFIFVESLPMTQNGKIDRKQLINEVNS
ncbi:D-alanine--poly(phosphoribitol) ligase subunit DltA [Vagococcus bubulae]|uniref:D-alanine--D-alanyl carrier protein ligase n=1 Tax=Vagococcus bubulae TaxID=1977868 RepID=A0A429ZQ31_9ENTE|nr:D-alanine--poly(phosphoribitol) ligase subunit DltA [Vagococcus bubulae]RST95812.1 D-alanine--poly(phosphoribitol) ligase subunit 1 [Vagococcus bubulae]